MTDRVHTPAPRHMVLAFMAGLSIAARRSARMYIDQLECVLVTMTRRGAE